jgi:hypothetical protein
MSAASATSSISTVLDDGGISYFENLIRDARGEVMIDHLLFAQFSA